MNNNFCALPLITKKLVANDIGSFTFSTKGYDFQFLPGQYTTMQLSVDGMPETRDFSIASSPLEENQITIVTKKGFSGFKKRLFELVEGDEVEMLPPRGGFILDTVDNTPQVFIAGGIGITPFFSMLTYAVGKHSKKQLTLFISFSRVEDIIFYDELSSIGMQNSNIKIVYTVSSPITGWHGERGRIHPDLIKKYVPNVQIPNYYIVGKADMVDDMFAMLRDLEVPSEKVKIEYFTGY